MRAHFDKRMKTRCIHLQDARVITVNTHIERNILQKLSPVLSGRTLNFIRYVLPRQNAVHCILQLEHNLFQSCALVYINQGLG